MDQTDVLPELKQIIGAMLFVRKEPLVLDEIRRVLRQTGERRGGAARDFAKAGADQLREAIAALGAELTERKLGFHVVEVANGFRLENDANCGSWLRVLLQKGKSARLSRPALETLAIIAYRQPCVRSEIEAVRGVAVDQILRNLLELQLVRVVGRSELPGHPWQFGTTQKFLEHFGLKSLDDLPGTDELRQLENEQLKKQEVQKPVAPVAVDAPVTAVEKSEPDDLTRQYVEEQERAAQEAGGGDAALATEDEDDAPIEREEMGAEDVVGAEAPQDEFDDEEDEDEFDDEEDEFDEDDEDEENDE